MRGEPATRGGKPKRLTQNLAVVLRVLPLPSAGQAVRLPVLLLAVACTVLTGLDHVVRAVGLQRAASTG
jgi:hypothetical protein